jgi:hypothetical protein
VNGPRAREGRGGQRPAAGYFVTVRVLTEVDPV